MRQPFCRPEPRRRWKIFAGMSSGVSDLARRSVAIHLRLKLTDEIRPFQRA